MTKKVSQASGKTKVISLNLPLDIAKLLEQYAAEEDRSMSVQAVRIIREHYALRKQQWWQA
jgi:predicted transcriptional regulator